MKIMMLSFMKPILICIPSNAFQNNFLTSVQRKYLGFIIVYQWHIYIYMYVHMHVCARETYMHTFLFALNILK